MHKPTDLYIPNAINTKFRYLDTAFFITFTRNKAAWPTHQEDYEVLLKCAKEKYRLINSVTITDAQTRKTIETKLRQKIIIDYITNCNFNMMPENTIAKLIKYMKGFIKSEPILDL